MKDLTETDLKAIGLFEESASDQESSTIAGSAGRKSTERGKIDFSLKIDAGALTRSISLQRVIPISDALDHMRIACAMRRDFREI